VIGCPATEAGSPASDRRRA